MTIAWSDSVRHQMYAWELPDLRPLLRDMLTALEGPDPLHPTRKGAVLLQTEAVSYATLEPGATATPSGLVIARTRSPSATTAPSPPPMLIVLTV